MAIEIKAPTFPESVADGTVATWHKQPGDAVKRDELIVDIETDKVVMEVLAEADGVMGDIVKGEGETVLSGELLGTFEKGGAAAPKEATKAEVKTESPPSAEADKSAAQDTKPSGEEPMLSPAARKIAEENGLAPSGIEGTGKGGRVTKEDVVSAVEAKKSASAKAPAEASKTGAVDNAALAEGDRVEKRVPMTRLRARIAERLVDAQSSMAMLTTFNEVNMKPIMDLRSKYKDLFEKKHNGVRLGFMSFFIKAATEALKRYPAVNASIDGSDVVYHGYQDIGVAVSSERGLVVPILRNTEFMSLATIEGTIAAFGRKAKDGKLSMEDMTGGTFTISNGGVFGSLIRRRPLFWACTRSKSAQWR
jgi:2-oxoglutarate dehydrogenase E2 component (dihydrolipoamide succinyltransferase)